MKSDAPLVSIITVNYNAAEATLDFLSSLSKLSYPNWEVIVVDNASKVNPEYLIKESFPDVVFIRSDENLGFAGGNNLGIESAKGDYLLFVNNDTVLSQDLIPSLLSVFELNPKVGGVSPKIKYEGTNVIQYAGYTELSFTARNKAIGNQQSDGEKYANLIETPYLHGAAMMISREVINVVGPMPSQYFLYYEELDWSVQIQKHGFELMTDRRVAIMHKASVSVGQDSPLKTYYMMRNRWLFIRRNGSILQRLYYFIYVSLLVVPKNTLKHILKGEKAHLKALLEGYFWHYKNLII